MSGWRGGTGAVRLRAGARLRRALLVLPLTPLLVSGCGLVGGHGSSSAQPALPAVAGSFGSKPALSFLSTAPPKTLQSRVLSAGSGRKVANGDLLVADVLGQVWRGPVFDDSFDRQAPSAVVIGRGKVITGWDDVLVGVTVGSRVVMSVPPDKAYGAAGLPRAGIRGADTLVFVVDVVAAYNRSARGDARAAVRNAATPGVTVKGAVGAVPTVAVSKGAKAPATPTLTVLARGAGAPVTPGLLVVQYVATRYSGGAGGSTYARGTPAGVVVGDASGHRPFDLLRGVPLGSRVLLEVPASKRTAAVAVVVDLVGQPPNRGRP